ncbi:MAG TPA: DUF4163 domain-containing protein [Sphingomonas sp.]|nr:DUF4163 domain-containing protein [Sphingomonas sp.]
MMQLSAVLLPLALVACSSGDGEENAAANAPAAVETPAPATPSPLATPQPSATPVARSEKTGLLDFHYAYPAAAAAMPDVAALLDKRAHRARAEALKEARQDKSTAAQADFPFHAHVYHADWTVAADTPRLLSLVGTIETYTGGAHGMTVYQPLLWDKTAGKEVDPAALFTSAGAAEAALRTRFCDALDAERAKKRGEPVTRSDEPFSDCIDPLKETLVPAASGQGAIDGFTVYVAPYDAGPYAEGSYTIPVSVDADVLKAVKPEYREAFAATK